jgi:predicted DNA-binding transcriptional regulator AlpA
MEPLSSPEQQEPFVDAERAANFLAMRRKTLLNLARRGRLPGHPVGSGKRKMWKFRISELDRWMLTAVNLSQRPGPCSRRIS